MNVQHRLYNSLSNAVAGAKAYASRQGSYKKVMTLRKKQLAQQGINVRHLTKEQKIQIREIYKGERFLYDGYELFLTVNNEFDPWLFPEDLFRIKYESKLNDQNWANVCYEKAYFERFMPDVHFSHTILRNVEGFIYDADFKVITEERGRVILSDYSEVVFKPSDMWCGRGVTLMRPDEVPIGKARNFIVQERIHQHPTLSMLNDSSVNIVRINTLIKGTEVIPLPASCRVGGKGQFTDNTSTSDGLGMVVIGIDDNGCLKEKGYYSCALPTTTNEDGLAFKGIEVPKYKEMVDIAIKNHPLIPKIRFIGWDFTVDCEGNVIVMEINPKYPGVFYYQLANGPLFGSRSQEIYKWMKTL